MKKRLLSVLLVGMVSAFAFVGCGSDSSESSSDTKAKTEANADADDADVDDADADADDADDADAADGEMISDESFEALQDAYASMKEAYDAVLELYSMDEIKADADINDLMSQADEIIAEMGEITKEELTEEDGEELANAMVDICDALGMIVDGMEVNESAEGCSDETFAALQEDYAALNEVYEVVVEYYNTDEVEASEDVNEYLEAAADCIAQMGEVTQDSITEEDAVELDNAMAELVVSLSEVADAM